MTISANASEDWRIRVDEQVKLSRTAMRADTAGVLTISIMLKKNGDEKDRDSTLTRLFCEGDVQVNEALNDDGLWEEISREHSPADEVRESSLLSMFDVRNSEVFTLTEGGYDDDSHLIVTFEPVYPADSLYTGVAHIDTSAWFPVRMEMTMSELPDQVKEMAMVAVFERDGDGVYRPSTISTDGHAKWLLLNFYFRTETQFKW